MRLVVRRCMKRAPGLKKIGGLNETSTHIEICNSILLCMDQWKKN